MRSKYRYLINVAAKWELFQGYSVVTGHSVFRSGYKVIFGEVKALFVNQDYNQDHNLFTKEGIMGYAIEASFSLPTLSPTLALSSLLTVSGIAFPNAFVSNSDSRQ